MGVLPQLGVRLRSRSASSHDTATDKPYSAAVHIFIFPAAHIDGFQTTTTTICNSPWYFLFYDMATQQAWLNRS